ncbi:hypothetical protein M5W75_18050 [Paenibacillus larvae]|uniref:hypothetical protein n=1 Tax=Paenibacillus larvae TaxID=1464 RepID=UPI000316EE91|nr:hypothetical protein [Paenibacillus larvae]MCY9751682.1 hypothetical protein [Paenibacillus larvae]MEC0188056.1 hypothetical protein [Paenibacillus larvae]
MEKHFILLWAREEYSLVFCCCPKAGLLENFLPVHVDIDTDEEKPGAFGILFNYV